MNRRALGAAVGVSCCILNCATQRVTPETPADVEAEPSRPDVGATSPDAVRRLAEITIQAHNAHYGYHDVGWPLEQSVSGDEAAEFVQIFGEIEELLAEAIQQARSCQHTRRHELTDPSSRARASGSR